MLNSVTIRNLAVIEDVNIDFFTGFSVLTGETGAGKSLIVTSLGLLSGEKFRQDLIRTGAASASVSGIFSRLDPFLEKLSERNIVPDEDGNLEIRREFYADGRSTLHINGRSYPLSLLREISTYLIQINGQEESHALSDRKLFIQYLDEYSGITAECDEYRKVYQNLLSLRSELEEKKKIVKEQVLLIDVYKNAIREIDGAKLTGEEEKEKITQMIRRLKSVEKTSKYANLVYRALSQNEKGASAVYLLEKASSAMDQLSDVLDNAEELSEKIRSIRFELEDIASQAISVLDGLDVENPMEAIDALESRLETIRRLEKKYGGDIPSVLAYREEAYAKLKLLSNTDEIIGEIEKKLKETEKDATERAEALSGKRKEGGKKLEKEILDTLVYLDMPKVRFSTQIDGGELNARGMDTVNFLISANPGETPMPLEKVASGGELARVMLSLKCALAKCHGVDCIVFDEIDSGVSGSTSEKIGLKLKELSEENQVLCVTHSPQIASKSDRHYLISKEMTSSSTKSHVKELDSDGRVSEIARLISGISITQKQRDAAEILIQPKP
ncbi:MAG: DNA repair protein RecN [Clostridia bacterium]|nr:DNA repair protein RecN [Clostridia bacterium]